MLKISDKEVDREGSGMYIPLRDSPDALLVNYLYIQMRNGKTGNLFIGTSG
jgi:hypothetical protein